MTPTSASSQRCCTAPRRYVTRFAVAGTVTRAAEILGARRAGAMRGDTDGRVTPEAGPNDRKTAERVGLSSAGVVVVDEAFEGSGIDLYA